MNPITEWIARGTGIATGFRHGRTEPAPVDELLDAFMPVHDVCDRQAVRVDAPADITLAAAEAMELAGSRIVRAIFRARELFLRSRPDATPRPRGVLAFARSIGWGVLAETPGREIVLGAVTRPWEANPVFRTIPPAEFASFAEPDHVKIAWTLRADPTDDGGSIFRTETRAVATDAGARKKFRRYWWLVSPGIVLIRAALLPTLVAAAERAWRLEGDDLVPDARAQFTHAITIEAPPTHVWPWLVQMGCQRAGWYSWDRLDNGGTPSADRIIPELQHLAIGDVLPARPVGAEGFRVLRIQPERALVLAGLGSTYRGTWAFVLEPIGTDRTRLVTRYRAAFEPSPKMSVFVQAMGVIHAFMERRQLRTIKHHAEHLRMN